jgi:predicted TIM-barrel fold metal-dependent hydrolase
MKPHPQETEDIEIIDAHSHIGNIIYEGGGEIIDAKGLKGKNRVLDTGRILAWLRWEFGKKLKRPGKLPRAAATYSGRQRISGASLENWQAALERSGVSRACCLPVPPNVTFEDLKKAKEVEDRVIPFTGVDFDDMDGFHDKLRQDVDQGACGMKIHPILQNVSPTDLRVYSVVEEFGRYGLPILFHTGETSYYFGDERKKENPEYGRMKLIERMVAETRGKADIILGHAGIFDFDHVIERMPLYPNVFVDTTFQSPRRIQALINAFGSERVVFGSDWPYGDVEPSIECVRLALAQESDKRVAERVFRDNIRQLVHLDQ